MKEDQSQAQPVPHPNEVRQQMNDHVCELRNVCCFISRLQSYSTLSHGPPAQETQENSRDVVQPSHVVKLERHYV